MAEYLWVEKGIKMIIFFWIMLGSNVLSVLRIQKEWKIGSNPFLDFTLLHIKLGSIKIQNVPNNVQFKNNKGIFDCKISFFQYFLPLSTLTPIAHNRKSEGV